MPKCPSCGGEIDHLDYHKERDYDAEVRVSDGRLERSNEWSNVDTVAYTCPKCDEVVARDDKDALKFLQG